MELMTKREVCAALSLSERTLENYVRTGRFPAPVLLGRRATWAAKAVENWKQRAYQAQLAFEPRKVRVHVQSGVPPLRSASARR